MNRAALVAVALLAVVSVAVLTVRAQRGERTLVPHEDLTPPAAEAARTAERQRERQPVIGPEPSEFQNPSAIAAGAKLLPEPDRGAPPAEGEPVFGRAGFAADRDTEARPDYATGADGTLHYVEVFNPSVVPFKRMTSLDAVRSDYTLYTDSNSLEEVPIGGTRRPDRELFWGSLVVELRTGRDVAIPSVSPDMRILSYEVKPQIQLSFAKDRADNFFVSTDEAGVAGTYRLVFLADASAEHFAPEIPSGVRVRDLPRTLVRPMPPDVRRWAQRALDERGLHRGMRFRVALDDLVNYFRSFEAKDPPPPTGNIFWDLYTNQAGVCRHRSFAFMITANALGIPARYLANEAHAWVEVFVPNRGWVRVDLGGAALRLEIAGAEDKAMHRPRGEDPFPQPSSYANNYTQLVGDIGGLSPDQIAERQAPIEDDGGDDSRAGSRSGSGDGSSGDDGDFFARSDDAVGPSDGRDSRGRLIGPGRSLPQIPAEELVDKIPTAITVADASTEGFRGETIRVSGRLRSLDEGLVGQRINIFMAPAGQDGDGTVLVGYTVSGADGEFSADVEIPTDFELETYEVYAATPGTDKFAPAVSR